MQREEYKDKCYDFTSKKMWMEICMLNENGEKETVFWYGWKYNEEPSRDKHFCHVFMNNFMFGKKGLTEFIELFNEFYNQSFPQSVLNNSSSISGNIESQQ
jgi:hypothetical protein